MSTDTDALITIPNKHVHPSPRIDIAGRYMSTFENRSGDQLVILIDRDTGAGEVIHGDMDWESHAVSRGEPFPDIVLSLPERMWVASAWCAALQMSDREFLSMLSRV